MQLAVVVGQVVSTVRCDGLGKDRLLLVDFVDAQGQLSGVRHVAADSVGAGNGEWVLVVTGSSARKASSGELPIDLSVIGIVDQVVTQDQVTYRK
jgi:ethanolamine utilization protein EutN